MSEGEGARVSLSPEGGGWERGPPADSPPRMPSGSSGRGCEPPARLHASQLAPSCGLGTRAPNPRECEVGGRVPGERALGRVSEGSAAPAWSLRSRKRGSPNRSGKGGVPSAVWVPAGRSGPPGAPASEERRAAMPPPPRPLQTASAPPGVRGSGGGHPARLSPSFPGRRLRAGPQRAEDGDPPAPRWPGAGAGPTQSSKRLVRTACPT